MKILVSILIFFFLSTESLLAQCKDSSLRLRYTFDQGSVYIENFKQGNNNSSLISGQLIHPFNSDYIASMMFGKTNSSGKLLWAKYAYRTPFPDNCMIQDFEETPNAIYWAGVFSTGTNRPFVVKTDQAGNNLASFFLDINYGSGLPTPQIERIKYISDNEIYLIVSVSSSGSFPAYNFITRFKSDGSVVWSKAFRTGDGSSTYNGHISDICKYGNDLIMLGYYHKSNSLDDPITKAGIIKMKLNSDDGSLITSTSVYIPLLGGFNFILYHTGGFKLSRVFNGWCFSSANNPGPSGSQSIKINMDSKFDISKIIQIHPISSNLNDIVTDISTNNNNESCITINNNYDNYFTILNNVDSIVKVKKLTYPYPRSPDFYRRLIFDNSGSVNQLMPYYVNPYNKYELVKFSKESPVSTVDCLGKDTSYVKLETISYSVSDFAWEGTATNIVQTQSMTLATFNITMQDEVICKEEMICDAISLTAADTICDISQPIIIKAHKNQSCLKKVAFRFDTTAVISYSQTDDTTLVLSFNNNWTGKIYASPGSCTTLVDSVQLSVIKPMPTIDLGENVTYCPGKNYSFNAHSGYKQYLWQDGSNDSIFIATMPGRYFITATDYCNRIYTDTVIINEATFSLYAGKDTSICQFEKLQLNATQGFSKYTWTPAYRISNIVGNAVTVSPEITTSYSVSAEKFPGCVLKDTVTVTIKDCPNQFFIPNAFSPNRDSKNDIFKPIISGTISNYEFSIYNRWGQLIFNSIDKNNGWDGTLKGLNQNGNVFVWICKFKFSNEELQIKKGTVVLIR